MERILERRKAILNKQIKFAQGRRWSDPITLCPDCNKGNLRKDIILAEVTQGQQNMAVCDKCGYSMDLDELGWDA